MPATPTKNAELRREKSTQTREKSKNKTFAMRYVNTIDIC